MDSRTSHLRSSTTPLRLPSRICPAMHLACSIEKESMSGEQMKSLRLRTGNEYRPRSPANRGVLRAWSSRIEIIANPVIEVHPHCTLKRLRVIIRAGRLDRGQTRRTSRLMGPTHSSAGLFFSDLAGKRNERARSGEYPQTIDSMVRSQRRVPKVGENPPEKWIAGVLIRETAVHVVRDQTGPFPEHGKLPFGEDMARPLPGVFLHQQGRVRVERGGAGDGNLRAAAEAGVSVIDSRRRHARLKEVEKRAVRTLVRMGLKGAMLRSP